MATEGDLPPLPAYASVAHVHVPHLLYAPDVEPGERSRLARLADRPANPPDPMLRWLALAGVVAGVVFGIGSGEAASALAVAGLFVLFFAGPYLVDLGHWRLIRQAAVRSVAQARRDHRLIVGDLDLDEPAQNLVRIALEAVERVRHSRAHQDGRLPGGLALILDQQWRVMIALAGLTKARHLLANTGGHLPEQHRAVARTEQAVENRVRALIAYAEAVDRVDRALADLAAATQADSLDHVLRDTLSALGGDEALAPLSAEARDTRAAVEAALQVLRSQAEVLSSFREEPSQPEPPT